jgi:hypothetical protein
MQHYVPLQVLASPYSVTPHPIVMLFVPKIIFESKNRINYTFAEKHFFFKHVILSMKKS